MKHDILNSAAKFMRYADRVEKANSRNKQNGMIVDLYKQFNGFLHKSVNFSLPKGGCIFNDGLKGLVNTKLRLPFECISVEYQFEDAKDCVLILARQSQEVPESKIILFCAFSKDGKWRITDGEVEISPEFGDYGVEVIFTPFSDEITPSDEDKHFANNYMAYPVLEMLEALSCTNVEITTGQKENKPLNDRRIKSGKLPLLETKILTIKPHHSKGTGTATGGTHSSPRQHLRRGHIRRIESGNIWVNSCIVGDSKKGIIKKSYKVAL